MLSRTPTNASIILQNCPLAHERYIEKYAKDEGFKDVYGSLMHDTHTEELDDHINVNLLYHLGKFCIPHNERVHILKKFILLLYLVTLV